jgi:hypothetical protein
MHPVPHTAPLAIFSTCVEVIVAIALLYAGLTNFRYRSDVQRYVREIVIDVLPAMARTSCELLRNTDVWAVLCRLGKLCEIGACLPDRGINHDKYFLKTWACSTYNWLYLSNLDKAFAMSMGYVAGTQLPFAILDGFLFPDPVPDDPARATFLTSVAVFYWCSAALGIFALLIQRCLWVWDLTEDSPRHRLLLRLHRVLIVVAVLLFVATLFQFDPYLSLIERHIGMLDSGVCMLTVATVLGLAAVTPILLIVCGNALVRRIKRDALDCKNRVKKAIDGMEPPGLS